jgi:predicted DNA binding protein
MWILKLKLDSSKQPLGELAIKHNVSLAGYPLSFYEDKKFLNLIVSGIMFGEENNKKAFLNELKKNKNISELEFVDNFAIFVIREPLFTKIFYNPQIIQVKPTIISKGNHIWNLASFNRNILEKIIKPAQKYLNAELLSFKEEKLSNISITGALPDLTINQKKALEIAINQGYYNYPKKVKMEKLAGMMGISYSTFQAHLKKAEGKILPEVYKEL